MLKVLTTKEEFTTNNPTNGFLENKIAEKFTVLNMTEWKDLQQREDHLFTNLAATIGGPKAKADIEEAIKARDAGRVSEGMKLRVQAVEDMFTHVTGQDSPLPTPSAGQKGQKTPQR